MKIKYRLFRDHPGKLLAASLLLWLSPAHGVPLPSTAALPLGTSTVPGFAVRVAQAPLVPALANNAIRAVQQINGTLLDDLGDTVVNQAVPGFEPDGSYVAPVLNFEKTGTGFNLLDYANGGAFLTSFAPEVFPGIPGSDFHTENFALEAVAFVQLTAGSHTFGVSIGTDRTDVNNDDSFAVFVARNPRDYSGLKVEIGRAHV